MGPVSAGRLAVSVAERAAARVGRHVGSREERRRGLESRALAATRWPVTAYDNALAESTIGLYKTELIRRKGPWKGIDQLELRTLEWVDWYNNARLHSACEKLPPVEYETKHHKLDAGRLTPLPEQPARATL